MQDMLSATPEIQAFYETLARLTGGNPEAIRMRYAALEAFEQIGAVYYYQWLSSGEILPQVLEDCMDAKMYIDAARELESDNEYEEEIDMAFFEKLGDMAKNIGDKTGDAIEINKLNGKIKTEKAAIDELLKQIGAFYLAKHMAGEATEDGITEYLATIDGHNAAIAEAEAQIQKIKEENEAAKTAAAAPASPETGAPAPAAVSGPVCPSCGMGNPAGTKFCCNCGAKLEEAPTNICPSCGKQNNPDTKFCCECGAKLG